MESNMNNNLQPGFITIAEAIKLIESDTRKDPVVDGDFLVDSSPYIRVGGNFNIKLLTRAKDGRIVDNGNRYVQITSEWEKAQLVHAIFEHYKQATGKALKPEEIGVHSITTAIDEDKNPTGAIREMDEPMTKVGDATVGGESEINE